MRVERLLVNNMVKDASKLNPKVLFDTINNIVTPASPDVPVFSNEVAVTFSPFLWMRLEMLGQALASLPLLSAREGGDSAVILNGFSLISLQDLIDLVGTMKTSSSPLDLTNIFKCT